MKTIDEWPRGLRRMGREGGEAMNNRIECEIILEAVDIIRRNPGKDDVRRKQLHLIRRSARAILDKEEPRASADVTGGQYEICTD